MYYLCRRLRWYDVSPLTLSLSSSSIPLLLQGEMPSSDVWALESVKKINSYATSSLKSPLWSQTYQRKNDRMNWISVLIYAETMQFTISWNVFMSVQSHLHTHCHENSKLYINHAVYIKAGCCMVNGLILNSTVFYLKLVT